MNALELLKTLAKVADDKRAVDQVALDLQGLTTVADYFLILSTLNSRQLDTLSDTLIEAGEVAGLSGIHPEGDAKSGWVLLDFDGVVVHLFSEEGREHYNLEKLWHEAPLVDLGLDA